ncbi:MAG TPA: hypothetical protein VMU17_00550 [Elusimicrobiota bacterium]|nr:hypothetical protein [Elusimicrobiota bacterium]
MKAKMAVMAAILGGVMTASGLHADSSTPASNDLARYLAQLQLRLDHAAQRANQPSAGGSSVVGLRGSQQESPSKELYWKGKTALPVPTTDEIKAFRAAIEQARAGQTAAAVSALKRFNEKYPKSPLRSDADETIQRLTAAPAAAPAPTAAPASVPPPAARS